VRILVVLDDPAGAFLLERALSQAGHKVAVAVADRETRLALSAPIDALLTDWVRPRPDGFDLIRHARATITPAPLILVVTALGSDEEKARALDAGADDYLAKPDAARDVVPHLSALLSRRGQSGPPRDAGTPQPHSAPKPPFVGVGVAASAGGVQAVLELFRGIVSARRAAFFVVLHGPAWMLETFVPRLQGVTPMKVRLAADGARPSAGEIHLAPGERHLTIASPPPTLRLLDEPPVNFVWPSADPLFRSLASAFGPWSIAVVLTGMGRDGAEGASSIAAGGGMVMAQDPGTALARSMPQTVVDLGIAKTIAPLAALPEALTRALDALAGTLPPPGVRSSQPPNR